MPEKAGNDIPAIQLQQALARVCASSFFARAPQLRRLLDFLATSTLEGRQNLKAYTIGVEALGRPPDFDPEKDAIVRVQAARLRRALDAYYAAQGRSDPIRIRLPTGHYQLAFELQEPEPRAEGAPVRPAAARNLRKVLVTAAVLLIAVGLLVEAHRGNGLLSGRPANPVLHGNGLPTVVIHPFVFRNIEPEGSVPLRYGWRQFIAATFARFELVNTVFVPRPESSGQPPPAPIDASARYDLTTFVMTEADRTNFHFLLSHHQSGGAVVWSRMFEVPSRSDPRTREMVARALATTLLQPSGVITSHERRHHLLANGGDPRYGCLLEAMDALRSTRETAYAGARACLERTIEIDRGYSLAYAYLSSIHNRYFQYGVDSATDPTGRLALEKALWAARRAAQTNPTSARAQFALAVTYFNMGDADAAIKTMDRARELNPYDMLMLAEYAGRLITLGRIDEGLSIIDESEYTLAARACTHLFYEFTGRYLRGDMAGAIRLAREITCPAYPYSLVAKALADAVTGDLDSARQSIEKLRALMPIWRNDPAGALRRMFPNADIAERFLRDLGKAGLQANLADG